MVALTSFLAPARVRSPHTRRAYVASLLLFWDWYESTTGRITTPDRVDRADALRFSEWLRSNAHGIDDYRLHRDAADSLDAVIYDLVKAHPGIHLGALREHLLRSGKDLTAPGRPDTLRIEVADAFALDKHMACLVERRLLARTPSIEELRRSDPTLLLRMDERVDPELFAYFRHPHTAARGVDRIGSVVTRLRALSSFWGYLATRTAENAPGAPEPLLRHNIWNEPLRGLVSSAADQRAVSRSRKTPSRELFERILWTAQSASFEDVRDRAVLLFFYWTGVRPEELAALRRRDVTGSGPPIVTVLGKGERPRSFALPVGAEAALADLRAKLEQLALDAERRDPGVVPRTARLLADDAPLFPAVSRWGCNARAVPEGAEPGLGRQALAMMLRRRANAAGIPPGSPDFVRLHPHGLRHLAALEARARGVPLERVQAVLGHRSLATTGQYIEARDPRTLSLDVGPGSSALPAPALLSRPAVPPPRVVSTIATQTSTSPVPSVPAAPGKTPSAPAAPAPPPVRRGEPPPLLAAPLLAPPALTLPEPAALPLPSDRLIAVGGSAPASPASQKPDEGFDAAYSPTRWGEPRDRDKLHERKTDVFDISAKEDALTRVYRGRRSGLLWWEGPSGSLTPNMPLLASLQLVGEPDEEGSVLAGLEELWTRWVLDEETDSNGKHVARGPTAAKALVLWFVQAAGLAEQTDFALAEKQGVWLPYRAEPTRSAPDAKPYAFRMHRADKLVLWFRLRAYAYMEARGRSGERTARVGQLDDKTAGDYRPRPIVPTYTTTAEGKRELLDVHIDLSWYDDDDPVAALPSDERTALLDWLSVLTGKPPIDTLKRFRRMPGAEGTSLSRVDLAKLIDQLCEYDAARTEEGNVVRRHKDGDATASEVKEAKQFAEAMAATTNAAVLRMRGPGAPSFDIKSAVAARVRETRTAQAATAEMREVLDVRKQSRQDFYLRLLGDLFGPETERDEVLRAYAICDRPRLEQFQELFRVDAERQTIVHTHDFAVRFARETGTHSECVARRIARHLWEIRRAGVTRLVERKDELVAQIATWKFYRIPCPARLETELRDRLIASGVAQSTIRDAWRVEADRLVGLAEGSLLSKTEAIDRAEMAAATSAVAVDRSLLAEGAGFHFTRNATRLLPTPIRLLACLAGERRDGAKWPGRRDGGPT